MTGQGGARPGAGRKKGSPNHVPGPGRVPTTWRFTLGQDNLTSYQQTPEGATLMERARVIEITRTRLVIQVGEVKYVFMR